MADRRERLKIWFRSKIGREKTDPNRQDSALDACPVTVDSSTPQATPDTLPIPVNSNIEQQTSETSSVVINSTVQDDLQQDTSATTVNNTREDTPPRTVQSLWERAYDTLTEENPELVKEYDELLKKEQEIADKTANGENSTPSGSAPQVVATGTQSRQARLGVVIERGLHRMKEPKKTYSIAGHDFNLQDQITQAANFLLWAKDWVADAVKVSPEASLAWSGVCLILPLITNPTTASEANRDGFVFVTTRMRYYTALYPMLQKLGDNKGVDETLFAQAVENVVNLYKAILDFQISSVLRFLKPSLQVFVRDMVSSKDWKKAVLDINTLEETVNGDFSRINDLASRQELESLSTTSEEALLELQGVLFIATQQLDVMKEQLRLQKQAAQQQMTSDQRRCLQQFCLTKGEYGATYDWYKDRVEDRVKGTCNWFLKHENFERWLAQESGPLLVSADPGCGKSVLAKYLINEVLPLQSATICYFFFKDQDQDTVCQALCALLHQLFSQKSKLIQHAMKLFDSMGTALIKSESSLWAILKSSLQDSEAGSVIIVLDALDECREAEFRSLVRNMQRLFPEKMVAHTKLKILMTSRPYDQIINEFWELLDAFPYIRIPGEEKSEELSQEINHVINHRVDQLSKKLQLSGNIKMLLRRRLLKVEHRTYLWVYLVFDHLNLGFRKVEKGVEDALDHLPQTIDQAYDRILCHSKNDPSVCKALSIILAAKQPLTLGEMNFAMTIRSPGQSLSDLKNELQEKGDFQRYLRSLCGLFVSVYHGKVYFMHQTAREFLLNSLLSSEPARNLRWHHSISIRQAHTVLAKICIFHLDQFNSDEIKDWSSGDHDMSEYVNKYDLLHYAALNWGEHLRIADICDDSALDALCISLCDSKVQSHHVWCSIYGQEVRGIITNTAFVDLIVAAFFGLDHVAQVLLDKGADVEARDSFGQTPLMTAAENTHYNVMRLLLDSGADTEAKNKNCWNSLMFAARNEDQPSIRLLLDGGADTEAKNKNCWTPLMFAARNGDQHSIRLLLDRGADTEAKNKNCWTPLMFAARNGDEPNIRLLLDRGADIEAKDKNDWTPLMFAARDGDEPSIRLLLDRGADIEAMDIEGWTPLMLSARTGYEPGIRLLLDRGADIEAMDNDGRTALWHAIDKERYEIKQLLLERGAQSQSS